MAGKDAKMYKATGTIDKWDDIPWDTRIIVTGSIDGSRAWMLRMPGVFKKDSGDCEHTMDCMWGVDA